MQARRPRQRRLEQGGHVLDVGHRLDVVSRADHDEPAAGDLVQQVVDVAAVSLPEHHRGPDDGKRSTRGIPHLPGAEDLLGRRLGPPVVVERRDRS